LEQQRTVEVEPLDRYGPEHVERFVHRTATVKRLLERKVPSNDCSRRWNSSAGAFCNGATGRTGSA
jgi:hypothetical protein